MKVRVVIEKTERRTIILGTPDAVPQPTSDDQLNGEETLADFEEMAFRSWSKYKEQPAQFRLVSVEIAR